MAPLFSLAVISYNSESTIGETLDSLLRLEGRESVELILADDASTDGTRSLIEDWLKDHGGRFANCQTVFLESNVGISRAHIKAFEAARGLWGLYLGGDDFISEARFIVELGRALSGATGHLYRTNVKEFYPSAGASVDYSDSYRFLLHVSASRQFRYLASTGYPFRSGPGTVFRIQTLWSLNGFGGYHPAFEDWQLYLRFTRAGYRIGFLPIDGVMWRRHKHQFSTTGLARMRQGNAAVKRKEIYPFLNRLSLFERWKLRVNNRLSRRLNLYYQKYLEILGKLFRE